MIRAPRPGDRPVATGAIVLLVLGLVAGGCAPAEDVGKLFKDLNHPDYEIRFETRQRLEKLVREENYQAFVRGLRSDNLLVRANSIVFLSHMKSAPARRAMRNLLKLENRMMLPYNPVRMKATREMSDSRFLAAHMIHLGGDDPEAIQVLIEGVDDRQPADVLIGTCLAVGALRDAAGIPFLGGLIGHADVEVVRAVAQALGQFDDPEAIALLGRLATHAEPVIRGEVLSSLSLVQNEARIDIMRSIGAADPEAGLRATAIEMLSHSHDSSLVQYLVERLGDEDERVRDASAQALGHLTGEHLGTSQGAWKQWWADRDSRSAAQH